LKEEIERNQPREENSDCLGSVEEEPVAPVWVPRANGPDIDRRPWAGEGFDGDSEREVDINDLDGGGDDLTWWWVLLKGIQFLDEFVKDDLLRRPLFNSF